MISIIVPVYKAEAVLDKCVRSVLAQDFQDWELLLIDDGSPDGSGALCDRFAEEDGRIRVIHKENGGVSSARNRGMEEARGEYILFIDADDWIEPDACTVLWNAFTEAGADSAGCAHWNIQPSGEKYMEKAAMAPGVYGPEEIRRGIVEPLLGKRLGRPGEVLNGFIWRFLFSREIILENNIRFAGAYLEDELFLMEYFCLAKRLVMVEKPLYFYLQNPNSVTRNYLPDYMDTFRRFLDAKRELARRFELDKPGNPWEASTLWAGLLIAVGNEYAASNPAGWKEKRRRVEAIAREPDMAKAVQTLAPQGLGRNKQLCADLIRKGWFGPLTLLYRIKNR